MFRLAGSAAEYSYEDALDTVRTYACATKRIASRRRFPDAFEPEHVPHYAYRTYDCVPPAPGPGFSDLDLLVSAGLNARIDVSTLVRLRSFANRAADYLDEAHTAQPNFLELTRDEVSNDPPDGTAGRHLYEAWRQGAATPGLGVARVHKVLHHKRPRLVPLLDNKTLVLIGAASRAAGSGEWQLIHDELHAHADSFDRLARDFSEIACDIDGVSLTWLRLYDILVWMEVTGERRH